MQRQKLEIEVLSGLGNAAEGHTDGSETPNFLIHKVPVTKKKFAFRLATHRAIVKQLKKSRYDFVLIPIEKKNSLLIATLMLMRIIRRFNLISYNHLVMRSKGGKTTSIDRWFAKFCFRRFDRVIFYTEGSRDEAVDQGLMRAERAYFANNTLDTNAIWNGYSFEIAKQQPRRLLFIGRLVGKKKLEILFDYLAALQKNIPDIELHVIGDGPARQTVEQHASNPSVTWHGAIHDEPSIRAIMRTCHLVFVPGHTGLSIVHAFCYGKPFVTLGTKIISQPPEIEYLRHGQNGVVLSGNKDADVQQLTDILSNAVRYEAMCNSAYETAQDLRIENWSSQFETALTSEA